MTRATEPASDSGAVLEIKAAPFTLPVIRLLRAAMDEFSVELQAKVEQAPDFFRHAPVVIDLGGLDETTGPVSFPRLVGLLRGFGMLPVGLRGGAAEQQAAAQAMELVLMGDRGRGREPPSQDPEAGQAAARGEAMPSADSAMQGAVDQGGEVSSTLITRPVRSGQKVYAAGGDLTIVAPVNSGAELMADGNIHVYGPLRGRVFAGIRGYEQARIFCQDLQAELVAVAGHYRVSENIPQSLKNARVQIFLERQTLRIEPF